MKNIKNMKSPIPSPTTNAFMVFSLLLLGVLAASMVIIFDNWFDVANSISKVVFDRLKEANAAKISLVWIVSISGLTLTAVGFFFYISSFLLIAVPAFFIRDFFGNFFKNNSSNDRGLFLLVSDSVLCKVLEPTVVPNQSRRIRDIYMYLLLTSTNTINSANAKFSFTQLMFARSIGVILIFMSFYICHVTSASNYCFVFSVTAIYLIVCLLYIAGLNFYELVMAAAILVEEHNKETEVKSSYSDAS